MRQNVGDLALQLLARDGIERAKGLVEQQNVRVERERPGEADALLHAAGNFVRIVAGETFKADEPHEAFGALGAFAPAAASPPPSRRRRSRATVSHGNRLNC